MCEGVTTTLNITLAFVALERREKGDKGREDRDCLQSFDFLSPLSLSLTPFSFPFFACFFASKLDRLSATAVERNGC